MTVEHHSNENEVEEDSGENFGESSTPDSVIQGESRVNDSSECLSCKIPHGSKLVPIKLHTTFLEFIGSPVSLLVICVLLLIIVLMIGAIIISQLKKRQSNQSENVAMELLANYSAIIFPVPDIPSDVDQREFCCEPPKYETLFINNDDEDDDDGDGLPSYESVAENCEGMSAVCFNSALGTKKSIESETKFATVNEYDT